jgi:enamine deaminase RidA (YjgF/YER057c/UK114 family)
VLQALAQLESALGSLDRVERVLKVTGFVASAPGFTQQPQVIDAASELLVQLFEEDGRHARSAVGVAELPRGVPVEIELVVAVRQ